MMEKKISVLIVEDQAMPAELFAHFVKTSDRYELVSCIDSASYAEVYCLAGKVDLILMDVVTAGGSNGILEAEKIKKKYPRIKIIIVTSMPEYSFLSRAKEAGVEGFWYKEVGKTPILEVMDRVSEGEKVYPEDSPETKIGLADSHEFTSRELQILREVTGGYSNQEIAEKMGISPNVVRNHIATMLEKTGFRSRTQLAVRARESGLVILDRSDDEL